jgi:hypothetical protein
LVGVWGDGWVGETFPNPPPHHIVPYNDLG